MSAFFMLGNFYKAKNAAENDFVYSDEMKKFVDNFKFWCIIYLVSRC